MVKRIVMAAVFLLGVALPFAPASAADDLMQRMNDILQKAPAEGEFQIKAADLAKMIAEKKTDFLVVDVRIAPPAGPGQQGGKIPGSIWIPVDQLLKAENIKKLPKDKKVILVCVTGQTTALPILPLRALGYNVVTTGQVVHPGYDYQYQLEARGYPGLHYNPDWSLEDVRYLPQNLEILFLSTPAILPTETQSSVSPHDPLCTAADAGRGLFDKDCPLALPRDVGMSILLTSPAYLLVIEVAVALLAIQAIAINRLAGLDYPLWARRTRGSPDV